MQQAPYARAYLEFLTEYVQNSKDGKGQGARFSLAFVDDDDIPELLLMEDDCHAEGVKVFTYYQDQVVELGAFGYASCQTISIRTFRHASCQTIFIRTS